MYSETHTFVLDNQSYNITNRIYWNDWKKFINLKQIKMTTQQTALPANANVQTTTVAQTANEVLGTPAKNLYYLIIQNAKGKLVINVGEKTYNQVKSLTETVTNIQLDKPKQGGK